MQRVSKFELKEIVQTIIITKQILDDRKQRQIASKIVDFIFHDLLLCPRPRNRKLVMERVLSHVKVCKNLLDYILPTKIAMVQQEILVGVNKALKENKQANIGPRLATKHVILTASMGAHNVSSIKGVAEALGVHVRNVLSAMLHHKVIDNS